MSAQHSSAEKIANQYAESLSTLQKRRRLKIAEFFRVKRVEAGRSVEEVATDLGLESHSVLLGYEDATEAIPLEDIFALTNVLNIAPEEVLGLMHEVLNAKGTGF